MSTRARIGVVLAIAAVVLMGHQAHADSLETRNRPQTQSGTTGPPSHAVSPWGGASHVRASLPPVGKLWSSTDPTQGQLVSTDRAAHRLTADGLDDTQILAAFCADASVTRDPLVRPSLISAGAVPSPGDGLLRAVGEASGPTTASIARLGSALSREPRRGAFPSIMVLGVIALGVFGLVRFKPTRA